MIRKILFIIFSISSLPLLSQKIQQNISVKEYAKSAPYFISRSPEKLTEYLTAKDSSEAQTVLNIYTWITNNIKYDIKVLGKIKTKSYSLKQTLRKKKGICSQFSKLFIILCNNAGISAREVVGYSQGLQYHEGDAFYETDHSWVSVKLDSAWFLIDPTWGSGSVIPKKRKVAEFLYKWFGKPYINDKYKFVQVPNYSFLFIEPSKLIETHLPADPAWQLIEFPISVSTFENTQWKKYVAVRDSSYSKEIERSEYVNQLNSYEYLSPNQYLAKTANQANNFNPKNYKLLGISFFANAPSISKMSPDSIIYTSNQEAIIDLKSAIHFSKKHQKTIKTETRKTIREQKRKIRKELEEPNQLSQRYILQRIRQGSAFLEKAETRLNSYKENISRLKYILENRNYGSLTIDKFPRKRPKLILINRGRIRDESASLVIIKDSVKRLMAELKDLVVKKESFYSKLISLDKDLSNSINQNTSAIIENKSMSFLCTTMISEDSIRELADSLFKSYNKVQNQISDTNRAMQDLHSEVISACSSILKMLYQNCLYSNGSECNKASYQECVINIKNVYRDKLNIKDQMLQTLKNDYTFWEELQPLLLEINHRIEVNAKLINLFKEKRISGILFKRRKGLYETDQIINKSNHKVNSLEKTNRRLRKKILRNK